MTHMPYTPGVDEAVMSRYAVLTPAAWQDFAAYVQQLEAGGHHGRARTLASSVVEIRHAGHGLPGGSAGVLRPSWSLPPIPWVPCREEGVPPMPRGTRWVPFSLDWGCGVVGIVLRCPAPPRLKRGLLTMAAHRLWSGFSLEWLALPAAEARPLLIRYNEHIDLRQMGPGCPALRGHWLPGTGAFQVPAMQSTLMRGMCGERMRAVRAAWLEPSA